MNDLYRSLYAFIALGALLFALGLIFLASVVYLAGVLGWYLIIAMAIDVALVVLVLDRIREIG